MNFDEALAAHPRKPDLLGDLRGIDDGLGPELHPADLWRAGISEASLATYARNLFTTTEGMLGSRFFEFDYVTDTQEWAFERATKILARGKDWFIEPLRELQPRSYAVLAESTLLCGYHSYYDDGPPNPGNHASTLEILLTRDRALGIELFHTGSPEENGISGFAGDAWPEFLLRSWWYRLSGYKFLRELGSIGNWAGPLLAGPYYGTGINHLVEALGPKAKRAYMPLLKEMFGADTVTKKFRTGRVALLCFLDTRPPLTLPRPLGDQLLVRMDRSDKVIYHVRECRFDHIRVMNPSTLAECLDRYFEHVLTRVPGEFDFMPYSSPM
ncbi:MAG: hypothetical protein QM788_05455 [Roseateles sp.]|uniref:hypothetical protein n=1 Tax=Roseateles sp. TaxID=1971397 RepID=UPI0039ED8652